MFQPLGNSVNHQPPSTLPQSASLQTTRILLLGLWLCAGCGHTVPPVELYPVIGTVALQGKPAMGSIVMLHPLSKEGKLLDRTAVRSHGIVDSDGHYRIQTFLPADGVKPGQYAVTIAWPQPAAPGATPDQTGPDRLNGRYSNPERPLRTVTISPGTNDIGAILLD